MSSKINLQTCEYACKSSIFQDNQLILHKFMHNFIIPKITEKYLKISEKSKDKIIISIETITKLLYN